jgi:hypothetical protein
VSSFTLAGENYLFFRPALRFNALTATAIIEGIAISTRIVTNDVTLKDLYVVKMITKISMPVMTNVVEFGTKGRLSNILLFIHN